MFSKWPIVVLLFSVSVSVSAQELLVNGDFESGTVKGHFVNGYPDGWEGWNQNGWYHSDTGYKRDNYGIAIWANDTGCVQVVDAFDYGEFELSGEMIYHTSEVLVNKEAILKIEFWDGPISVGTKLSETQVGTLTPGHTAGTWYTFSGSMTAPAGTRQARVICQTIATSGGSTGKAFWDNISLEATNTTNSPDYNDNGNVDFSDLTELFGVWCQTSSDYNLIGDDYINLNDFRVFADAWQATIPDDDLVWSDEFNGPNIDTSIWNWEIGDWGWGNNELQYYSNHSDNSYISNGDLVIVARKNHLGHNYTSARMTTQNKQSFMYGRLEARIKLPVGGQGIWPAFWMLGNNFNSIGWPECGELDILEVINDFTNIHGALHYGSSDPYQHDSNTGSYNPGLDVSADYHTYAVEWEPTEIRWYFDDVNYYTISSWWAGGSPYPAPFNQQFFFILNIAVGGNWPGNPDGSTPFPQMMYIDYVRVYELQP